MDSNTDRQQILNIFGDKAGNAGPAIVNFVEQTVEERMRSNREEIVALINENNVNIKKALDLKADKADIDDLNGRLRAAADALRGADAANGLAHRAVDANSARAEERIQQAEAATDKADTAVSEAKLTLESLNERVESLEDWRKNTVDPELQQLRIDVNALRGSAPQPPVHDEHEHDHRYVDEHPHTQALPVVGPHHHRHEEVVRTRQHYYNPVHWNWIQWVLALALGLALTATLGIWLRDLTSPVLHEWSWLWLLVTFLIGFFGGGLIGSIWDTREQEYDEQTVVRRDREHDDHDEHTVVRLRA